MGQVKLKRIYEPAGRGDGKRFLVERLWPRGVSKERAALAGWLKEVAPSAELCTWYGHDPAKWSEFRRRYFAELARAHGVLDPIIEAAREGTATLVFATKDTQLSNARALKEFLEQKALRR